MMKCFFGKSLWRPANIDMLKVSNRITRKRYKICSKLTIKTPERRQWHSNSVFIANNFVVNNLFLEILLWTLSMYLFAGKELFLNTESCISNCENKDFHRSVFSRIKTESLIVIMMIIINWVSKIFWLEMYLEPCEISMIKLFWENIWRLQVTNYFCKIALS